jgi:hypothetical protein
LPHRLYVSMRGHANCRKSICHIRAVFGDLGDIANAHSFSTFTKDVERS